MLTQVRKTSSFTIPNGSHIVDVVTRKGDRKTRACEMNLIIPGNDFGDFTLFLDLYISHY